MASVPEPRPDAVDRYLVLTDISGYTSFLAGVAEKHGEDFSAGLPAGYRVLGELLEGLIGGLPPDFEAVKVEGDAVFGAAPANALDGRGAALFQHLGDLYRAFAALRDALAVSARDDKCSACFAVASLNLKMVLHRGLAVRQPIGGSADLIGPAVNVAHRLLKNTVRERVGFGQYLLLTRAAAEGLGQPDIGLAHRETYPDVGVIETRIVDLAQVTGMGATPRQVQPDSKPAPEIRFSGS